MLSSCCYCQLISLLHMASAAMTVITLIMQLNAKFVCSMCSLHYAEMIGVYVAEVFLCACMIYMYIFSVIKLLASYMLINDIYLLYLTAGALLNYQLTFNNRIFYLLCQKFMKSMPAIFIAANILRLYLLQATIYP